MGVIRKEIKEKEGRKEKIWWREGENWSRVRKEESN